MGLRTAPGTSGHDSRGFRNRDALSAARIVAIGDSQTWGINASVDETWPSKLARLSGSSVYNMSRGGYATPQYLGLLEEALALHPNVVIVAFYSGNDLWETYRTVYGLPYWGPWRLAAPDLDPDHDPTADVASRHWESKKRFLDSYARWPPSNWPTWLRGHLALGRFLESRTPRVVPAWSEAAAAWAGASHGEAAAITQRDRMTTLTLAYRAAALDIDLVRIREGLRLTKLLLAEMARATGDRASLMLLFIPTKERVYAAAYPELSASIGGSYPRLIRQEDRVKEELLELSSSLGWPSVDPTDELSSTLSAGAHPYPSSEDGHPTAAGYAAIANSVAVACVAQHVRGCTASPAIR